MRDATSGSGAGGRHRRHEPRLALVDPPHGAGRPVAAVRVASPDAPSLEAVVDRFLADSDATVVAAASGVAGPVLGDRAEITNLAWTVHGPSLFRNTFAHKGRFGEVVAAIPVSVILEPAAGLGGAAVMALARADRRCKPDQLGRL